MNTAIVLAGGVGSRMGADVPKQFIMVNNKPIIAYCLETFQKHDDINNIVIVADIQWRDFITSWIEKLGIDRFYGFAQPGETRQLSIYNGLKVAKNCTSDDDVVIIHDAARPLVSNSIISDCIQGAIEKDGAMPVVSVKDTIYHSIAGDKIDNLLERSQLYAGQAPESFKFGKYLEVHDSVSIKEIEMTVGSSEIAHKHGMEIKIVEGDNFNFKITTKEDLASFEAIISQKNEEN